MVEWLYTEDLKSSGGNSLWVRIPPAVPKQDRSHTSAVSPSINYQRLQRQMYVTYLVLGHWNNRLPHGWDENQGRGSGKREFSRGGGAGANVSLRRWGTVGSPRANEVPAEFTRRSKFASEIPTISCTMDTHSPKVTLHYSSCSPRQTNRSEPVKCTISLLFCNGSASSL